MANVVYDTVYFENPGPENTDETLRLAKARAETLGIKSIIVASTTGSTGVKASEVFKGYNLVVVTLVTGLKGSYVQEFLPEHRKIIESNGGRILTATHAFFASPQQPGCHRFQSCEMLI